MTKLPMGGGSEADGVAVGGGAESCFAAGDVEVGYSVIGGEADQVGVVGHSLSVVAPGPEDLRDGMSDAAVDGGMLHAVVVRVLVGDGRDKEGPEELAGHIFSEADADVAAVAEHTGAVGGMAVGGDRDASFTGNGDEVERIKEVAGG